MIRAQTFRFTLAGSCRRLLFLGAVAALLEARWAGLVAPVGAAEVAVPRSVLAPSPSPTNAVTPPAAAVGAKTNGAGPVQPPAEFPKTLDEIMRRYDKNGNGRIDRDEREAMRRDQEAITLQTYDKNRDGKLDEEEQKAMREAGAARRAEARRRQEELLRLSQPPATNLPPPKP